MAAAILFKIMVKYKVFGCRQRWVTSIKISARSLSSSPSILFKSRGFWASRAPFLSSGRISVRLLSVANCSTSARSSALGTPTSGLRILSLFSYDRSYKERLCVLSRIIATQFVNGLTAASFVVEDRVLALSFTKLLAISLSA